jgi:uncharacterized protein (TIGR02611 family)
MPSVRRWVWYPLGAIARLIARNGRRLAVTFAGFTLVLAGMVLLVIPGPGVALIVAGLAVLATEYVWAQRALNYARRTATRAKDRALNRSKRGAQQGR